MSNELKILIVDDHNTMREALTTWFDHFNIKVVGLCSDGDQVLPFLENNQVDTIIMDVNMPNMDGFMATKLVKDSYPEIRVFGLSSHDESFVEKKMMRNGADNFFLKTEVGKLMSVITSNEFENLNNQIVKI